MARGDNVDKVGYPFLKIERNNSIRYFSNSIVLLLVVVVLSLYSIYYSIVRTSGVRSALVVFGPRRREFRVVLTTWFLRHTSMRS